MFTIIVFLIIVFDQLIKFFVHKYMYLNQSIPLITNILNLTYVQNTGAAFGLLGGWRAFLLVIGFVVIVAILYINAHLTKKDHLHLPLAIILGGSIGNLVDRIFRCYVIDYIDFRVWPVFNLADIMINLGFVLLIYQILFNKEEKEELKHELFDE